MKFLRKAKDGGPKSTVTGYWLAEIKSLFSIALLKFEDGSRAEYHSHAFNSLSWVLKGRLREEHLEEPEPEYHGPDLLPVVTRRDTFHRVYSQGTTWVLTFRGPWAKTWHEYDPRTRRYSTLAHGRRELP
jgi:hypothetical protein